MKTAAGSVDTFPPRILDMAAAKKILTAYVPDDNRK